ncbi:MAG: flagellar hook-basal body complex protein, partial [Rhodospirillaceae bacterium]
MSSWGTLTNSAVAMMAHSHALGQISTNVSNMNTTAYKAVDTHFQTLMTQSSPRFDFFSTKAVDYRRVSDQGNILQTGRSLDMAISGDGFFTLNTAFDGSGETLYTRDGNFTARIEGDDSYLTTSDGLFLRGWAADGQGNFPEVNTETGSVETDQPLVPLQLNTFDTIAGTPTTAVTLRGNLDARTFNTPQTMGITVYDAPAEGATANTAHNMLLTFNNDTTQNNTWNLALTMTNGGTATLNTTELKFNGQGELVQPATQTLQATVNYPNGSTGTISLDLKNLTQFAGETRQDEVQIDGMSEGLLAETYFDSQGVLHARYSNNVTQPLYKLAMADFVAPDNLEALSGNLFRISEAAGERRLFGAENSL